MQLTDQAIPFLDLAGVNLQDYALYVRKLTSGGQQDFKITLAAQNAPQKTFAADNKNQMRTLQPDANNWICFCLGGKIKNDNQGGIYFSQQSTDQDNDGDRIRPNPFNGYVWYKWSL